MLCFFDLAQGGVDFIGTDTVLNILISEYFNKICMANWVKVSSNTT